MKDKSNKVRLEPVEIAKLSSHYLNDGRKQESWQIEQVEISDNLLNATLSMSSTYVSDTDEHGFHLTIFSTLEFLSQLMIIYAHNWAGMNEKIREGWMVESHTKTVRAIRNPNAINVEMKVDKMRKRGENLYCAADFCVTDDQDGLFEVQLKGFLS